MAQEHFIGSNIELDLFDLRAKRMQALRQSMGKYSNMVLYPAKKIELEKNQEIEEITLFAPNSIGIFLEMMESNIYEAKEIYYEEIINIKDDEPVILENVLKSSKIAYKYISKIQSAIIFGFSAIESFVNISIPENYRYSKKIAKSEKVFNKEEIENNSRISIEEKLKCIIGPLYLNGKLEEQFFWNDFLELKSKRNDLVHMKSNKNDEYYEPYFHTSIWQILIVPRILIGYIINNRKVMRNPNKEWPWLSNEKNQIPFF